MISITKADVPAFLRKGEFYRNLSGEDDDIFLIPASAFKATPDLETVADLEHLLATLRYWLVDEIPIELLEFMRTNARCRCLSIATHCRCVYTTVASPLNLLTMAARTGKLDILECVVTHLEDNGKAIQWGDDQFGVAFEAGNLECLAYMVSKGCRPFMWNMICTPDVNCLRFALDNCANYRPQMAEYCYRGYAEAIGLLLERGYPWQSSDLVACAKRNYPAIIRLFNENRPYHRRWGSVVNIAAEDGYLEILQYAHEHAAPWSADTLPLAAKGGHWECLKYALEHGCPYRASVATVVAGKSLPVLQYLRQRGCEWDLQACMQRAVDSGDAGLVRFLRSEGAEWPKHTLQSLVRKRSIDALQAALGLGLPLDTPSAVIAVAGDPSADCLRLLHERGCPWDATAVRAAAKLGHLACLAYLLEHGCPVLPPGFPIKVNSHHSHPSYEAAMAHQLPCLRYLLEHGYSLALTEEQLQRIPHEDCRALLSGQSAAEGDK